MGDYVAARLSKGDQAAIIEGVPMAFNAGQRTAGFKDAMDAAGMTVVTVQTGMWSKEKAYSITSSVIEEYPDIKAFLCGNDNMALGAVAAVEAAGKTGDIIIAGFDNIPAVHEYFENGKMLATADQYAGQQAVFGIEQALKALMSGELLESVVETPVDLITRDNI